MDDVKFEKSSKRFTINFNKNNQKKEYGSEKRISDLIHFASKNQILIATDSASKIFMLDATNGHLKQSSFSKCY